METTTVQTWRAACAGDLLHPCGRKAPWDGFVRSAGDLLHPCGRKAPCLDPRLIRLCH
ncbi:MAG: hypothetical protein ACP5MJ_08830 [Roseiflexus sp.]